MNHSDNDKKQATSASAKGEGNFSSWFMKHWYLALFPTFVFAFGIRWGITTWNPGTIGFACALLLTYFVSQAENTRRGKIMVFIVPIVFLAFAILVPLPSGEVHNPRLDVPLLIGRASISATFGVLLLLGSVGLMKITRR